MLLPLQSSTLSALSVFQNVLNAELIKSIHLYSTMVAKKEEKDEKAWEVVQREFMFSPGCYKQIGSVTEICGNDRVEGLMPRVEEGEEVGLWTCILYYDCTFPSPKSNFPDFLIAARNPALNSLPDLVKDLDHVLTLSRADHSSLPPLISYLPGCSTYEASIPDASGIDNAFQKASLETEDKELHQLQQDQCSDKDDDSNNQLSLFPSRQDICKESITGSNDSSKKKKSLKGENKQFHRAPTEHVSRIGLKDLTDYFHLPISEAARRLRVGLTVLKRKCRELGIPRWPHRKIKSLDSLINDLQEEARRQEREDQAAAMAAMKRTRILESERQMIAKQPYIDIQKETKRFRQDIFKRRHRARNLQKHHGDSSSSNSDDGDLSGEASTVSTILTLMINGENNLPSTK